ncbi:MAG: caspase family protein [Deltaproteobacteria bacterium]|nr:caspase family protein [Deltaproteobacteria bacterium]
MPTRRRGHHQALSLGALVALVTATSAGPAEAGPRRLGLFVGTNAAPEGRSPLRYAEDDAARVRAVFVELGDMAPEDAILLTEPAPAQILDAIARLGARAEGAVLVFYYSGHADERALLLGEAELPLRELTAALAATGAQLGLQLVDACRSGALTRTKGAALGARLSVRSRPEGRGRVVITSSAEWEDAQESDRLGASFFTLHLFTALRGAADRDGDGRVTLEEAYRYVYGRTVESTLATAAGPQHPTYAYDLQGQGELVLTWTTRSGGTLRLAAGDYLVINEASGAIVAEVPAATATQLSLPAGEYRVRQRTRDAVRSGRVVVEAGRETAADPALTEELALARLVRKGGPGDPRVGHVLRAMGGVRGAAGAGVGAVGMLRLAWELVLPWLSIAPHFSATTGATFEGPRLSWSTSELGAGLSVSRALDLRWLTVRAALLGEVVRLHQVEEDAREPARTTWGSAVALAAGLESPPLYGFTLGASAEAAFYTYRTTDARQDPDAAGDTVTRPTFRVLVGLGYGL